MKDMYVFSQAIVDKDGYINLIYRGENGKLFTIVTNEQKVIYEDKIEKLEF